MGVPSEKYDAALGHIEEEIEYALQQVEWTFDRAEDEDRVSLLLLGMLETTRILKRERAHLYEYDEALASRFLRESQGLGGEAPPTGD